MITAARLREVLDYDPDTGIFTWSGNHSSGARRGDEAGHVDKVHGYRIIGIDGELRLAHRLAWLYIHGEFPIAEIDHINGILTNNSLSNLRQATRTDNNRNKKRYKNNRSGLKGVSLEKGRWRARIRVNGALKFLGYFPSAEAAHAAYCAAAKQHFGEFARTQ